MHTKTSIFTSTPGTIHTDRKLYRPKLPSKYIDPDLGPDLLDGQEIIFKEFGRTIRQHKDALTPRDDIILFDPSIHQEEFDRNIRWDDCPQEFRPKITEIIKTHWDAFAEQGLKRNIRGFSCQIDTGNSTPVCCKTPRYGPHESVAMQKLCDQLEKDKLIEPDDGPYGSLIVLAPKAHQENVPWHKYVWRLCVSYRRLNQIVRPFMYPIPRCDDAVTNISPKFKNFISFDLACGYWQVTLDRLSRDKTAFFTPNGKMRWTVMPMGFLNSHAFFVAMMAVMKKRWTDAAIKAGLHPDHIATVINHRTVQSDHGSKVIVDDVLLYAIDIPTLLKFFSIVLETMIYYRVTITLKKCHFLPSQLEFVGIDIGPEGNSPARSKFDAFRRLESPHTWTDLRMIIGMFGFYQQYIERFEVRIAPFRELQRGAPRPGALSPAVEKEWFRGFWLPSHEKLFEELKAEILTKPTLARPNYERRFYVKTDWSRLAMAAVLLQADPTNQQASELEQIENAGGPCCFELQKKGIRLRPIVFLSRACSGRESSFHSYIGEASVARWAFGKLKNYLLGREFTWLSDCSGLKRFFEDEHMDYPTHQIQRWRIELMQFSFIGEHRPENMLTECNMLSRYNQATAQWRLDGLPTDPKQDSLTSIMISNPTTKELFSENIVRSNPVPEQQFRLPPVVYVGNTQWRHTSSLAAKLAQERNILVIAPVMCPIQVALEYATIPKHTIWWVDDLVPTQLAKHFNTLKLQHLFSIIMNAPNQDCTPIIDWFVTVYPHAPDPKLSTDIRLQDWLKEVRDQIEFLLSHTDCRVMIVVIPHKTFPRNAFVKLRRNIKLPNNWGSSVCVIDNTKHGGTLETKHEVLVIAEEETLSSFSMPDHTVSEASSMVSALKDPQSMHIFDLTDFNVQPPTISDQALNQTPFSAQIKNRIRHRSRTEPTYGWPLYDVNSPGPSIQFENKGEAYFGAWFVASSILPQKRPPIGHPITTFEIMQMIGLSGQLIQDAFLLEPSILAEMLRATPGAHGLAVLFMAIHAAEFGNMPFAPNLQSSGAEVHRNWSFVNAPRDESTVIPLPTDQDWIDATKNDHDLGLLVQAKDNLDSIPLHLFLEKCYFQLIRKNQIQVENEIVYYFEKSKSARVRQVRVRVVPLSLRRSVIAACHSSPFGGHSGITRTLYRIQLRYWWPGMFRDIHDGIRGCAHCNLANAASHESQLLLHTLACDEPFDVVHLDIWSPGDICDKEGNVKVLTFLDAMTGFAMAAFLQGDLNAEKVANAVISTLFVTVGLPRLIVVDADGLFAGIFVQLFQLLQVPVYTVSRENHKAILNERFHRYLNKVQRINSADMGELLKWKQGVCFSLYGWNAAPIDGTDIARSRVAIGRDFPFPIDLSTTNPTMRQAASIPQQALDHFDAASPLLYQQRELLRILNDERRERHRELRNKNKTEREFSPGDIVIIRKQVKSDAAKGVSAKLLFKTKGPYRVLDKVSPNSYRVQKLPFTQGLGRRGRIIKQKASRMTLLPSTLILHKKTDGVDTRFANMSGEFANAPLQPWLGVLKHGAYQKAREDSNWAFEPLRSIWSEPVDESDSQSEEASECSADEPADMLFDDMDFPVDQQDSEEEEDTEQTLFQINNVKLTTTEVNEKSSKALLQLYRKTQDSQDKLFFIAWQPESASQPELKLAQVCWDECDPISTRQHGLYIVRWWSPRPRDHNTLGRPLVDCQFWPELRLIQADGSLGEKFLCRPDKAKAALQSTDTKKWPTYLIPLSKIRLVGPFDFHQRRFSMQGTKKQAKSEPNHIAPIYWELLEQRAPLFDLDVTHIRSCSN